MLLGAPVNAGLLFFPIAALMVTALKDRNALSRDQKTLWLWVVVMIVFYSIPTQRSVRYLLTAMPALAILLALGWDRLARGWFIATLALSALLLTFLGYESLALQATLQTLPGATTYPWVYWLMLSGATAFCVTAIRIADLTRPGAPIAALLVFLGMSSFLIPLDGASGHFSASAVQASAGRSVWVPVQVDGEDEPYRFLLPQAKIQPYRQANGLDAEALAHHYALFTVRSELKEPGCFDCRVLGERLVLKGRLNQHDVLEILKGRIFKTLILKESLVESRIKDALRAG